MNVVDNGNRQIGKYFGKWIKLYRYLQKINIESVYILTNTSSVIMVKSTRRTHRGIFQVTLLPRCIYGFWP